MNNETILKELEDTINYSFKNKDLLKIALTHSSYAHIVKNGCECNERLEYLGDAILEFYVSLYLYKNHSDKREGLLSHIRIAMVCETNLYEVAKRINLQKYLYVPKYENMDISQNSSVLADAIEAIIGAMYLDGGEEPTKKFIETFIIIDINKLSFKDWKSQVSEYLQSIKEPLPVFEVIEEIGPEHNKMFKIEMKVKIQGQSYSYIGYGKNKKSAQQNACKKFIETL